MAAVWFWPPAEPRTIGLGSVCVAAGEWNVPPLCGPFEGEGDGELPQGSFVERRGPSVNEERKLFEAENLKQSEGKREEFDPKGLLKEEEEAAAEETMGPPRAGLVEKLLWELMEEKLDKKDGPLDSCCCCCCSWFWAVGPLQKSVFWMGTLRGLQRSLKRCENSGTGSWSIPSCVCWN